MRKIVLGVGTLLLLGARFLLRRAGDSARGEVRDELTGLLTQAVMEEIYAAEVRRSTRTGVSFSVLLLEAAGLADLTRTLGRAGSRRVLNAIADFLRRSVRASDYVGRRGESRFMVILPETWSDDLTPIILRLRQPIACRLPNAKEDVIIHARIGSATWEPGITDLIGVAEDRLARSQAPPD